LKLEKGRILKTLLSKSREKISHFANQNLDNKNMHYHRRSLKKAEDAMSKLRSKVLPKTGSWLVAKEKFTAFKELSMKPSE